MVDCHTGTSCRINLVLHSEQNDARERDRLSLCAVVFDYGMVLSGPPAPEAIEQMLRITGLDAARLNELYWADRHAFDEGKLTGLTFWRKLGADAGLKLNAAQIDELANWDARMWTTENAAMVAWQRRLKERGLKTAVLSNMGDNVHERLVREFEWLKQFDALVWSYQLGIAKPDPAIYRCTLERLGVAARETLFVDDKAENVEAARMLGMRAVVFSTAARLREELIKMGMDGELPLPE
jgi:putative hydrolase of the HAD superfamily